MKTTLGAIAVTFALLAGVSGANALPSYDTGIDTSWENVFVAN